MDDGWHHSHEERRVPREHWKRENVDNKENKKNKKKRTGERRKSAITREKVGEGARRLFFLSKKQKEGGMRKGRRDRLILTST